MSLFIRFHLHLSISFLTESLRGAIIPTCKQRHALVTNNSTVDTASGFTFMALDHAQIAERTLQFAAIRAAAKGKSSRGDSGNNSAKRSAVQTPTPISNQSISQPINLAQIDPGIMYTKQTLFTLLGIGDATWAKWKKQGLRPIRIGKSVGTKGSALIAVLEGLGTDGSNKTLVGSHEHDAETSRIGQG